MVKKKIHVVRISTRIYPTKVGSGPAKHSFYASKFSSGHSVHMTNIACTPRLHIPHVKNGVKIVNPDFEIHYLSMYSIGLHQNSLFEQGSFFLMFILKTIKELQHIHRKERIDIIHAHSPPISAIPAIIFKLLYRIPFLYTYHGLDYRFALHNLLQVLVVNPFACRLITITKRIQNYLKLLNLKIFNKSLTMYNGIECPKAFPTQNITRDQKRHILQQLDISSVNENDKIILYVAKQQILQKTQGIIDFTRAFDTFLSEWYGSRNESIKLLIIGSGQYAHMLQDAVSNLKHKDHIILLGFRRDVPEFFRIADLSALTSYIEGFPNVILESMVAGVPVIGSDVGEVRKIIGDTGYIVTAGNRSEITSALSQFFQDPMIREDLRLKCWERVKNNFDWEIIGKSLNKLYKEVYIDSSISKLH